MYTLYICEFVNNILRHKKESRINETDIIRIFLKLAILCDSGNFLLVLSLSYWRQSTTRW